MPYDLQRYAGWLVVDIRVEILKTVYNDNHTHSP